MQRAMSKRELRRDGALRGCADSVHRVLMTSVYSTDTAQLSPASGREWMAREPRDFIAFARHAHSLVSARRAVSLSGPCCSVECSGWTIILLARLERGGRRDLMQAGR